MITLQNLSKIYVEGGQEHVIFGNLNTEIAEGEFLVIVGKSGSGKSTLLNLVSGIDNPTSGSIIINGTPLSELSEEKRTLYRRRHIGFVFQAFNLVETLTARENILLPLELNGLVDSSTPDKMRKLVRQLGIEERAHDYPEKLSGGEQQRVAIARALIHEPDIILADEPTGNLDLETGQEELGLLDRLVREAGKTLVMATHSREVIGLADRVLSIRDGQLLETRSAS